jgi:hypothetical protein
MNQTTNFTAHASADTNGLRDIRPPVEIPSGWEWLLWTLGALALAALIAGLLIWLKRRRENRPLPPPIPPHVRALERLQEALGLLAQPEPFVVAVSNTLRLYLEERFEFRAPERTTEEFLNELHINPLLLPRQKQSLSDFLERCDLVKFARYEPGEPELLDLHAAAVHLVEETVPLAEPPALAPAGTTPENPAPA